MSVHMDTFTVVNETQSHLILCTVTNYPLLPVGPSRLGRILGTVPRRTTSRLLGSHLVDKSVLGWPWPITWLLAPRAPTVTTELPIESMLSPEMLEFARLDCGNVEDSGKRADDEEGIETPPFSMEMAAVEIADAEDLDAAHIEVKSGYCSTKVTTYSPFQSG